MRVGHNDRPRPRDCGCSVVPFGASIYDVHVLLGFLDPLPLPPQNQYCLSANLVHFCPPFCADVIYGSPLSLLPFFLDLLLQPRLPAAAWELGGRYLAVGRPPSSLGRLSPNLLYNSDSIPFLPLAMHAAFTGLPTKFSHLILTIVYSVTSSISGLNRVWPHCISLKSLVCLTERESQKGERNSFYIERDLSFSRL